jgi:hypothetical protein
MNFLDEKTKFIKYFDFFYINKGYFYLLKQLSQASLPSKEDFERTFSEIKQSGKINLGNYK